MVSRPYSSLHGKKQKLLALLLLGILGLTFFPAGLFHHRHETEETCDHENLQRENNPCHTSVFHAHDLLKVHCAHDKHIHEQLPHCEICKHLASHNNQVYLPASSPGSFLTYTVAVFIATEEISSPHTFNVCLLNKGPPCC